MNENSLVATIRKKRPDLLQGLDIEGDAIPEDVPSRFHERNTLFVEDIGTPITATFFTKADADPKNW